MSSKILSYFEFENNKSIFHSFDPRGKLVFIISMTCITILFNDLIPLLFILAFIIPLIFLSRFFIKWMRALLILTPLLLIVVILNSYLLKEVESPTTSGIILMIRIIILTATFGIFFQTVSPDNLSNMLIKFQFPYSIAWSISTAYRFIPTLAKETNIITSAQKARGLQIDRGNPFKRLRNTIPLLIPIFASALRRSWQLAEAIESRGWNAVKKRTYLYSLKAKWWDYLFILLSLGIFAIFLWLAIQQLELPQWMQWSLPDYLEISVLFSRLWSWIRSWFQ